MIATASLSMQLAHWAATRPDACFLDGSLSMTFHDADREVSRRADRLTGTGAKPVVIAGCADAEWMLMLLACIRAEVTAALVPESLHRQEQTALEELTRGPDGVDWRSLDAAVAFASSGSTGAPRWVLRSTASVVDEGTRYQQLWGLQRDDAILVSPTLCHAYAFGAGAAAALAAGCRLIIAPWRTPRTLLHEARRHEATVLVLVAAMASALATADVDLPPRSIRIAMVGAGRPPERVSHAFARRFGVPLSHNYGTSETGALLASLHPAASGCMGLPLEGIDCELVGADQDLPQLWVRLPSPPLGCVTPRGFERASLAPGGWWATGDLFAHDAHAGYTLVGRLGDLIRRGGRTIRPREIETVLQTHPHVEDVFVRGQPDPAGDELIEAHVQLIPGGSAEAGELRQHAAQHLAPYKVPHRWTFYEELPRTWSSKIRPDGLRAAGPSLISRLAAYRHSEALLCAHHVGLLDVLSRGPVNVDALATRFGLDRAALELFLGILERTGVLEHGEQGYRLGGPLPHDAMFALEEQLRDGWLRAEAMVDALRNGIAGRRFERAGMTPAFADAYADALCSGPQRIAAEIVARSLPADRSPAMVEIGRGIGAVPRIVREKRPHLDVDLVALAPPPALVCRDCDIQSHDVPVRAWDALQLQASGYDVVLLTNAVHWLPETAFDGVMTAIRSALKPRGILAIADIFLPSAAAGRRQDEPAIALAFDWLTHGGTNWLEVEALAAALARCDLRPSSVRRFGSLAHHVILASSGR